MQKFVLLCLLTVCSGMVRGQTLEEILAKLPPSTKAERVHYWFDNDPTTTGTLQEMQGLQQIDASALLDGLHTLHLQIEDDNGKRSGIYTDIFFRCSMIGKNLSISQLRYWFDDLPTVTTLPATSGTIPLDVSALDQGLHTLYIQGVDSEGNANNVHSSVFLKYDPVSAGDAQGKTLYYWFDNTTDNMKTVPKTTGIQQIDVSELAMGMHTINYQVLCTDGTLTTAHSSMFLKIDFGLAQPQAQCLRYWFDDSTTKYSTNMLQSKQQFDVSMLENGMHTLHYQLVDSRGTIYLPQSTIFLKTDWEASKTVAMKQRYWFDDDQSTMCEMPVTTGTLMLDVNALTPGLHTVHYQLIDDKGLLTSACSAVFMKTKTGVEDLEVEYVLSADGIGTLILPFDAALPETMTAYTCSAVDGMRLQLESVATLTAHTPMIVMGTPGTYTFNGIPDYTELTYTTGLLTGVLKNTSISGGYVLQKKPGTNSAFYRVDPDHPITVPAYKCYLNSTGTSAAAVHLPDWVTDITPVSANDAGEEKIYSTDGRRVTIPLAPGVYIKGGKKYIKKNH